MTADRLRVVLVDDHELVRSGVRAEIGGRQAVPAGTGERSDGPASGSPVIEIVGEAGDVGEAIDVICDRRPDVVLLDVHLPGGDAPAVIGGVVARGVGTRYLALSVSDAAEDVIAVIRAGARGYVTKAISGDELVGAIARVAEGDAVFSPRLAGFVLDAFAAELDGGGDPELDQLTRRERDVLRLLARGWSYKEIAAELVISVKTVETHVSSVLRKTQLSNRYELSRWASDRRLV